MFTRFNRDASRSAKKTSVRRGSKLRKRNALSIEGLEDRVVYSASSVSVAAAVSLTEGQSYKPVITRAGDLSQPLAVTYTFYQGSANASDFSREKYSASVTIPAGQANYPLLPVLATDDKSDEYDESFYLHIAVAGNSPTTVTNKEMKLTIKDNDAAPNVSIAPLVSAKNEDGGTAYFRVSIDAPSGKDVYVELQGRSVGTFTWGKDASFPNGWDGGKMQSVTIKAGETYKDFAVAIKDDKIIENTETLQVGFTTGNNISGYGSVTAQVTIRDNDIPTVVIDDAGSIYEGNTAGAKANFKIRVLEEMERAVQVKYRTAYAEATDKDDYVSTSGTLTFGGNPMFPTTIKPSEQTVSVALKADTIKEATAERFYLGLGAIDTTAANKLNLPRTYGKATIVDDDAPKQTIVGTPRPTSATPSPENGFGMVLYSWAAASGADRYEISLRKENSFFSSFHDTESGETFSTRAIRGTTFMPIYTEWLSKGFYQWKVRAVAADGTVGAWSEEQRFEMPERWADN